MAVLINLLPDLLGLKTVLVKKRKKYIYTEIGMSSQLGKHVYLVLHNPKLPLLTKQSVDLILTLPLGHESYAFLSDSDIIILCSLDLE